MYCTAGYSGDSKRLGFKISVVNYSEEIKSSVGYSKNLEAFQVDTSSCSCSYYYLCRWHCLCSCPCLYLCLCLCPYPCPRLNLCLYPCSVTIMGMICTWILRQLKHIEWNIYLMYICSVSKRVYNYYPISQCTPVSIYSAMFPEKVLKIGYLPVLQQSRNIFMFVINATDIKKLTPRSKKLFRDISHCGRLLQYCMETF
jgi:hypothetical protein